MEDPAFYADTLPEASESARPGNGVNFYSVLLIAVIAVIAFFIVNNQIFARSTGAGGISSGCACCAPAGEASSDEQLRRAGLNYYRERYGDDAVEAVVEDYGCHQEIHIYQDGVLLKRLFYNGGRISE